MSKIVVNDQGVLRNVDDIEFAEKIVVDKKKKDVWDVVDELVKVWADKAPDDVEAMAINVEQYRESLVDKEFGQTSGGNEMERRFTLAWPKSLMLMIRTQYKADELPFDKKFFRKFGNRYPAFKVAQKI